MMPHADATLRHVFVYGTLRRGGRNDIARYRPAPVFVGMAVVSGTLLDLETYPGVVLGGCGRVHGEVYRITPSVEAELGVLEEVAPDGSGEYLRKQVQVHVAGADLACLVYELHPSRAAGREVIASGDWLAKR